MHKGLLIVCRVYRHLIPALPPQDLHARAGQWPL